MNTTAIVLAILSSPVLVKMIEWIKESLSNKSDPLKDAVCSLMRDRILHLCEKYIEVGEITHRQWESLYDLYEKYKALGGNGFIEEEMDSVSTLPRK